MTDEINPYQSPATAETLATDTDEYERSLIRSQKRNALWMMVAVSVALGLIHGIAPSASLIVSLAGNIAFVVLLVRWCALDCQELGVEPWAHMGVMLIFCPGPFIIMPVYFFKTRGPHGMFSLLWAAVFMALLIVVAGVSAVLIAVLQSFSAAF